MKFTPDFLQHIKDAVALTSVIGKAVPLQRNGRDTKACCPFHKEKTPSFHVHDDRQYYHCFGCGAHGDVFSFLIDYEGLSFPEAVERLASQAGLPMPVTSPEEQKEQQHRKSDLEMLDAVATWFSAQLASESGFTARHYIKDRGLSSQMVGTFRLGFAPDSRDALRRHLRTQGYSDDAMIRHGLLIKPDHGQPYSRFRNRLIFPITDRRGRVIAFGGRILGDGQPKYLNSPETPLFHKSHVLYNADLARKPAHDAKQLLAVEGYMDAIALFQGGFEYAVAPLGTAVTEHHLQQCWMFANAPIFCLDGDEAGLRAMNRVAELALPMLQPDRSIRFILLPQGEDPDTLLRAKGRQAFQQLIDHATPMAQMLWQQRLAGIPSLENATPEQKAAIESDLFAMADKIQHETVRNYYRDYFKKQCWEHFFRQQRQNKKPQARALRPSLKMGAKHHPNDLLLLALVLYHPQILDRPGHDEGFADYPFHQPTHQRLQAAILQYYAETETPTNATLKIFLQSQGLEATYYQVLRAPMVTLNTGLHVHMEETEARQLWHHVMQRQSEQAHHTARQQAARALGEDLNEESWQAWLKTIEN